MKNERILIADSSQMARYGIRMDINGNCHGHEIIGEASSIEEVGKLLDGGLRPTVAFVDNRFPKDGDGEKAVRIIKEKSPETVIISLSSDMGMNYGDYKFPKGNIGKVITFITNLEH